MDPKPKRTGFAVTRAADHLATARELLIFVDGKEIGAVAYGERKELGLAPGVYTLHVSMDWCRSKPYELRIGPGEMVELEAGGRYPVWAWPITMLEWIFRPRDAFEICPFDPNKPRYRKLDQTLIPIETVFDIIAAVLFVALLIFLAIRSRD